MRIAVVTGTTREGRFSEKVAAWVTGQLRTAGGFEIEAVDLRDYAVPLFDGPSPARARGSTRARPRGGSVRRLTARTGS